jgi:hypothetical protein
LREQFTLNLTEVCNDAEVLLEEERTAGEMDVGHAMHWLRVCNARNRVRHRPATRRERGGWTGTVCVGWETIVTSSWVWVGWGEESTAVQWGKKWGDEAVVQPKSDESVS